MFAPVKSTYLADYFWVDLSASFPRRYTPNYCNSLRLQLPGFDHLRQSGT